MSSVTPDFKEYKFEELVSLITDFTANGSFESLRNNVKYFYEEEYARLVRLTDLRHGLNNDGVYVDKIGYDYLAKSSLKPKDLLLANVGEYTGFACLMPALERPATLAPNMFLIRFNDFVDASYMYYLMSGEIFSNRVDCVSASSATKLLNKTNLRILPVCLPELPQQQKIAKILTTVDNLIEQTQALIDKYTVIKQGMMADLFTRGIDLSGTSETNPNYGKLRPSFEEAPELYKETELGWVPNEWEVAPLGNYLSIITYGFTNPMPEANDGPWMVTAANVINGSIDYKKTRKTTLEAFNNLLTAKSRPLIGDILLTKDGTLGRLAVVEHTNICINQSVSLLRCNDKSSPSFIKTLLEIETYQKKMLDDAGGSAIKHIYITVVDKMKIAVPKSINEQQEIFHRATVLLNKLQCEIDNLEKHELIKKGLMQDLLTGKVQVNA